MIDAGNTLLVISAILYKITPKLRNKENALTYYQRAFKKNILITGCGTAEIWNANPFLFRDNNAYICPGAATGKFKKLFLSKETLLYIGLNFSCLCTCFLRIIYD